MRKENLVGKRFNRITVIKRLTGQDVEGRCKCGVVKVFKSYALKDGHTKSCGCYNLEVLHKNKKEKNPNWKGDRVSYKALHHWIRCNKPKRKTCEACHKPSAKLDVANISQKYLRDVNDFEWLCRKCHIKKDGRSKRLGEIGKLNLLKINYDSK